MSECGNRQHSDCCKLSGCIITALYIHIPFCIKKCRYCDFYSEPSSQENLTDSVLTSILKEWTILSEIHQITGNTIKTIFVGGGTPSILSAQQWARFASNLSKNLGFPVLDEWTIECNPDSFTNEKALAWRDSGVTRLSIGVQSLDNKILSLLGRPHNQHRALHVLDSQSIQSFASVGVDLIYGIPGQTPQKLTHNVRELLSRPWIKHLSAYELTIAPGTPFGRHAQLLSLSDPEELITQYDAIRTEAEYHGRMQYEISNYAIPGCECRHNQTYWRHGEYIGLGPSAHSYIHPARFSNIPDVNQYCSLIESGKLPVASAETLTPQNCGAEIISLGLRTCEGISENLFLEKTGEMFSSGFRKNALGNLVAMGMIRFDNGFWKPSQKGLLVADALSNKLINHIFS